MLYPGLRSFSEVGPAEAVDITHGLDLIETEKKSKSDFFNDEIEWQSLLDEIDEAIIKERS